MTTAIRTAITEHHLQRLCLWLALVVARLVAPVLNAIAPHAMARLLDDYARIARLLLVARAMQRVAFKAPRFGPVPAAISEGWRGPNVRRVAGANLRRALRGGLIACLAEAERWIAHLTRRLQRGLTKLRRLPKPRRVHLPAISCAPAAPRFAADTS
jgi:hypothetical protein